MDKPLKICLIGSAQSIHVQRWGAFLAARGHEVHILSNFSGEVLGAKVWPLYSKERYGNLAYLFSIRPLYRLLRMLQPDIIHFHYLGGSSIYALVIDRLDIPVVASPWGSDIYQNKKIFQQSLTRRLLKKSDKVLTTSRTMSDFVQRTLGIPPWKLAAYSWGIDLGLFGPASQEDKRALREALGIPRYSFVIFSNRTMAPLYRTELITKAYLRAKEKSPHLFLILLESTPSDRRRANYREQIKKIVRASNESIKLVQGYISPTLMSKYLKASDAVVSIPYTDQRSTSVLEALASCPVLILSDIPPYVELQQEGYEITMLSQATEESLEKILLSVQVTPSHIKEQWLQANYKLIAEKENWEIQAAKIEGEYYTLLERGHQTKHQRK